MQTTVANTSPLSICLDATDAWDGYVTRRRPCPQQLLLTWRIRILL